MAARVLQAGQACAAGPGARLLGQALAAVAPFLPAGQVPAALAEARRLAVPRAWPRRPEENALAALARRLPQETVRQELAAAGTIRAAGLDVFRNEPKVPEALLSMPNVALTPHQGSSKETKEKMSEILVAIVNDHYGAVAAA